MGGWPHRRRFTVATMVVTEGTHGAAAAGYPPHQSHRRWGVHSSGWPRQSASPSQSLSPSSSPSGTRAAGDYVGGSVAVAAVVVVEGTRGWRRRWSAPRRSPRRRHRGRVEAALGCVSLMLLSS